MFYTLITLQIVAILIMFFEFLYIFTHWTSKQQSYLLLMVFFSMINTIGYTVEMLGDTRLEILSGCRIAYLGKAYVGLLIFLFVANYCETHVSKWLVAALTGFHTLVWVLVLTCEHHKLYYTRLEMVQEGMFPHIEYIHGVFYYIFVALQGTYFLVSIFLAFRFYRRTTIPKMKQLAKWLTIFLVVAVAACGVAIFGMSGEYDLTTLSYCVNAILFFVIVVRYDLLKTVDTAKNYAIEHLPNGILITDDSDHIIYSNGLAKEILEKNGVSEENRMIPDFLHENKFFYQNKAYQVEMQELKPSSNEQVGIYLIHDITDSYFFQERLKEEVKRQTKNAEDRRKQVEGMSLQTVETLAGAIDAKDPYTKGHSVRVAEYAVILAERLGYEKKELVNLRYAALLHDIGKISVPDSVLNKPSKLSDIEYNVIKSHTTVGCSILEKIESMPGIDEAARYHHERYDGKGYPDGISGQDIPENARIISIADSYDAMNSKRVYRNNLSKEKIREELIRGKGSQFDPDMLAVFLQLLDGGKLESVEKMEIGGEHTDGSGDIIQKVIANMAKKDEQERDSLTGLLLRKGGELEIIKEMKANPGALAFIDVDNLKVINDTMGHLAGDHLLNVVGQVLTRFEDKGVISRLGGDEFLFFIRNVGEQEASVLLKELVADFETAKEKDSAIRKASLSIGVCLSQVTDEYQTIYTKADKALYYVKTQGKSGIQIYNKKDENRDNKKADVDLKKLVDSLEKSGNYQGAMDVEYRMFSKLYEYTQNISERYHQNYELVMITLDTERGMEIDEIEKAMDCMGEAIHMGIRNVDICTRYSSVQYLIILMNAQQEEIDTIMDRIFKEFYKNNSGRGIDVSYHVTGKM